MCLKVLSYWNLNEGIENVYHWEMLLKVLSYWIEDIVFYDRKTFA